MLSSDILEQQFGPTKIAVLYQDAAARIICTKVAATGQVLEISSVGFVRRGVQAFAHVHKDIAGGQSMGKAFRARNIPFTRLTKAAYKRAVPASFGRLFGAARYATVVEVAIVVGADHIPYADIIETYSPHVQWPETTPQPKREPVQLAALDIFLRQLFSQ
jgi:hypothetical protein